MFVYGGGRISHFNVTAMVVYSPPGDVWVVRHRDHLSVWPTLFAPHQYSSPLFSDISLSVIFLPALFSYVFNYTSRLYLVYTLYDVYLKLVHIYNWEAFT